MDLEVGIKNFSSGCAEVGVKGQSLTSTYPNDSYIKMKGGGGNHLV